MELAAADTLIATAACARVMEEEEGGRVLHGETRGISNNLRLVFHSAEQDDNSSRQKNIIAEGIQALPECN